MALSVAVGSKQLLQLGVGIADIALLVQGGRTFGNFFRVTSNDDELLASIGEDLDAIIKRRDLIQTVHMERRWSRLTFIYQANNLESSPGRPLQETEAGLNAFSWIMIMIITALDFCLPSHAISKMIKDVFGRVLNRGLELDDSLRVLLPTNIQSWRSTGCARGMVPAVTKAMRDCRAKVTGDQALPQLNEAETIEMKEFLVWLLEGRSNERSVLSVMVYAVANALKSLGIRLRTEGQQTYENEPIVLYSEDPRLTYNMYQRNRSNFNTNTYGLRSRAQQIVFPRDNPMAMVHAVAPPGQRNVVNNMIRAWSLGAKATEGMRLKAEPDDLQKIDAEIYYSLEEPEAGPAIFQKEVILLAGGAFPARTEAVLFAVDRFLEGLEAPLISWLQQITEVDFLKRTEDKLPSKLPRQMDLFLAYQAFIFGFYYKLIEPLLSLDFVQPDACFKGIWGEGSTTFLGMCVEFGSTLRREGKVPRPHLLHLISTMYSGRQKWFSSSTASRGLLGILGTTSVLSKSLLHTSDDPEDIAKFMLADLPILDFVPDADGELYAGVGGGITFDQEAFIGVAGEGMSGPRGQESMQVHAEPPSHEWSLHAKMGLLFGEGGTGVVMAARCAGTLVGWFNPLAADVAFLSSRYQPKRHIGEDDHDDSFSFSGFQVDDGHWRSGKIPRPVSAKADYLGIVHSKGSPALRYAAAGFLVEIGEEVAIATDDTEVAFGRVELQGVGYIIA